MNNISCLLIGFLLRGILAQSLLEDYPKIETFVYDRCKNFSVEAKSANISNFYDSYNSLKDEPNTFCLENMNTPIVRMKNLIVDAKPCFTSPQEKFLPDFIEAGFSEFMKFLCGNRTVEIFFSDQGRDCREALKDFQKEEIKNCSRHFFRRFDGDFVEKEALCSDLKSAEECFDRAITRACPYFVAFKTLNQKLFRSVGKQCNNVVIFHINSLIFMISIFLSLRNFL